VRSLFATTLLLFILANKISAQDSLSLTLEEVVAIALGSNVDVNVSAFRVESAEFGVKEAAGNYLPRLTLNGTYNRNIDKQVIFLPETFGGGPTRIGLNNNFSTSLDLTLPIYSQANHTNKAYTGRNRDLAKENSRGTKQSVVNNIRKSYYQAVAAYETIHVRQKALANAIENSSNVEERLANGLATEFDRASARVKVKVAQNELLNAEREAELRANSLKVAGGIDVGTRVKLLDSLTLTGEERSFTGEEESISLNSSLRQTLLQEMVAKQQVNATKASYFPTLSVVGSYQYQSQQNDFNFDNYRWVKTSYVGLKLQVPLFNGMVTRNKVQQAVFSQKIARLQNEYTERNVESKLKEVLTQLQYSKEKIALQKENVAVSERALELTKERFNFGKGTFIEISSGELDLVSARLNYLQAVLEFKTAYYDYLLLTGREN
jgi:outer membrane protein TolC